MTIRCLVGESTVFGLERVCGKNLSLKLGWSPIRQLVTPAGACTQKSFVTQCNQHATPTTTPHMTILIFTIGLDFYYKNKFKNIKLFNK